MKTKLNIKNKLLRNSFLLVIAAWLITISFIIDNYLSSTSTEKNISANISSYINSNTVDFDTTIANQTIITQIETNTLSTENIELLTTKNYFLFVYNTTAAEYNQLLFWNTQQIEPDGIIFTLPGKTGFIQLVNGYYVWQKNIINKSLTAIALIPVKWNYSITNEYLNNTFAVGNNLEKRYTISDKETNWPITAKDGTYLFSLEKTAEVTITHNHTIAASLKILAMFFVLLFIQIVSTIQVQKKFYKGVTVLIVSVLVLRTLSYLFPIPIQFRQYELFDPSIYGSNIILKSLGDLLINAVLFLWIVLFTRHYVQEKYVVLKYSNIIAKWMYIFFGICLLLGSTFLTGHIIKSMVADSQISFDVINFFTLNGYSIAAFIVLGCLAIGYFFFTQIIIYLLQPLFPKNIFLLLLIITVTGLSILTVQLSGPTVEFDLYILIWLIVYLILLNNKYLFFLATQIISTRLIFWLFFFSLSISIIILSQNKQKEIEKRKQYAETLALKADPSSERMFNSFLVDFKSSILSPLFSSTASEEKNTRLKDSLINENFLGYLNKYDTRIFTFDMDEKPLFNKDATTFTTLNTILNTQSKPTAIPDLYYYDVAYDRFTYISKKLVTDSIGKTLGAVFILASPKKYKTDALYPELFLKGYNNSIENSPIYAYAVYNKLQLVAHHNDYSFPWQLNPLQISVEEFSTTTQNGYSELKYKAASDKLVVIAKKDNIVLESITMFSYLFCSFLFVTAIFWLLNAIIRSRLRWKEMSGYWQMSIRNQVHSTIIIISLLSFVVVGVVTILFFIDRYNNNNRERLSRTIHIMQNEVRNNLSEISIFDDVIKIYDLGYKEKLEQIITKISELHTVDINLYDLEGNLKVSSLPLPYNKGIVSNKINPLAYYHLHNLKEIQFFKEEKIGSLTYLSNYVPIIDEKGNEYAYLNIPYYTSQTKLKQEISNFLIAIINLNAFIFLIAGIVALFIANRITESFSFITNKMKEVNLGKRNEAIVWNNKDEIWDLVKEYNKMLAKLDESAAAMAKTEREDAWREMARQVAHEIKNPLTPMKLSLQYLQRAIENNAPNVNDLSRSVAKTLVEQIDHLSQIAGQFSQFANIGNHKNERMDIHELLYQVTLLHSTDSNVDIQLITSNEPVWIFADRTHINRLFTNLIQNGMQAVPDGKRGKIEIKSTAFSNRILVQVKDNGNGIPEHLHNKIFVPNFTTKTSGTGLGLAMSKGIVEQCKGTIWFETEANNGTSFFVELPIMNNIENEQTTT